MRTRTQKTLKTCHMYGKVMRIRKGVYEVVIKFVKSHRTLHVEQIVRRMRRSKRFIRAIPERSGASRSAPKLREYQQWIGASISCVVNDRNTTLTQRVIQ